MKKIGIIVQRYGLEINGGAEYHARLIAEKISKYFDVEVFTTTALDYITWTHFYKNKNEIINNIKVNRFIVKKERDPERFGKIQKKIFEDEHTFDDELKWLKEEGPFVPSLLNELEKRENEFEHFIFFSYRYYHSYHGLLKFKKKSILVPTAEHDDVIYMRIFKNLFNLPGAIIYNSHEEKELIHKVSGNQEIPGKVVGVGSEIPDSFDPDSFRKKYGINDKYILYIGRLDENKGVPELIRHFMKFSDDTGSDIKLILMGKSV
ncbi:MAG: glycosyltransferase family 1 protein, partial [Acidobacteriota bacterium]